MFFAKNRLHGSSAPTQADDVDAGYSIDSLFRNVASGELYACADTTPGAAVWTLLNPALPVRSGAWFGPAHAVAYGPNVGTSGHIYTQPLLVQRRMLVDRLRVNLVSAGSSGAQLRFGLYADRGLLPVMGVRDLGYVMLDGSADPMIYFNTLLALEPGAYLVSTQYNPVATMPSVVSVTGAAASMPNMTQPGTGVTTPPHYYATAAPSYGSPPYQLDTLTDGFDGAAPAIWFRRG